MGIFDFVKNAGAKMFGDNEEEEKKSIERQKEARRKYKETLQKKLKNLAEEMEAQVTGAGFEVENLDVDFEDGTATIQGTVASQEIREKIILLLGNISGVARVDDQLVVETPEPENTFYTVKSGDSLSKIAKEFYGSAGKYMVIFEANKPLLKDPNKIYPGQTLRIPPQE